jgi:hypothetical protein
VSTQAAVVAAAPRVAVADNPDTAADDWEGASAELVTARD